MTEPEAPPAEEVAALPEDEQPSEAADDPSAFALGGLIDPGVPRADSFSPDPAPTPPPASLPTEEAPAE